MKRLKKISVVVFGLLIVSAALVFGVALKDFFKKPAEHFQAGAAYLAEGDYRRAERAFLWASKSDDPSVAPLAAYQLGEMYRKGGVSFEKDGAKASLFLDRAARAGVPAAQYHLALMYDVGDQIPENREKALFYMNEAAKNGYVDALYALGVWIERGYMGEIDMQKVVTLYEKAAEGGHLNAATSLIAIYAGGFGGFPANIERSVYWHHVLQNMRAK